MSKEAYYFSHDSNAKSDPKIMAMISDYGMEGYGRFWVVIEMLREQDNFELPLKKYVINALAMQTQCDADAMQCYIDACINEYELFDSNGEFFWSNSLKKRMDRKNDKSEKAKKAAQARWKKARNINDSSNNDMQTQCVSNADAMQNDAIKGKEKKGKESKEKDKDIYTVFEQWNLAKIIVHKSLNSKMENHINARLKDYGLEQVLRAIKNFKIVLDSDFYYWSHRWTLQDFMKPNNIVRFLDESKPLETFRKEKKNERNKPDNRTDHRQEFDYDELSL